jgi:hypothetical protein
MDKKKTQRQIVYEKALEYAEKHFTKIDVKFGKYDGSQRCQHISRQLLEEGNADTVVVTLSFVPNSGVNVHFINKVNNEYVDNTLGYLSKKNFYYLISEHTLEELQRDDVNMSKMLMNQKENILKELFTEDEMKNHDIRNDHI